MSRSYRRPFATDSYGSRGKPRAKRAANKAVRRSGSVGGGADYRRLFDSYNIQDYSFFRPDEVKFTRK
jgi:hypothetical protein